MISAISMLAAIMILSNHFKMNVHFPKLIPWMQASQISLVLAVLAHFIPQFSNMVDEGTERLVIFGAILLSISSFKAWRLRKHYAGITFIGLLLFNVIIVPLLLFLPAVQNLSVAVK